MLTILLTSSICLPAIKSFYFDFVLFSPRTETTCLRPLESQGDVAGTEGWASRRVGEGRPSLAVCLQWLLGLACGPVGQQTWDGAQKGRRRVKGRKLGIWMSNNELERNQKNLCRPVGLWFVTLWPSSFSKENLRVGSGMSKQMSNQGVAKGIFHVWAASLLLGKMRVFFPWLSLWIWGLFLWILRPVCLLQVI